jgi:hypothetical protein
VVPVFALTAEDAGSDRPGGCPCVVDDQDGHLCEGVVEGDEAGSCIVCEDGGRSGLDGLHCERGSVTGRTGNRDVQVVGYDHPGIKGDPAHVDVAQGLVR